VLYGATSSVLAAHASVRWTPGAFFDADIFAWPRCVRAYDGLLLNSADCAERMMVRGFVGSTWPDAATIFVRPKRDTKEWNGAVWAAGEFRAWCRTACTGVVAGIAATCLVGSSRPFEPLANGKRNRPDQGSASYIRGKVDACVGEREGAVILDAEQIDLGHAHVERPDDKFDHR